MTGPGTARTAVIGATWLSASGYLSFVLNFAGTLILVRLLFPQDFGAFALVSSTVELLSLLSGLAFSQGIIQMAREPDVEDTAYRMTLWLCAALAILGLAVAGITWAAKGLAIAAALYTLFAARLISLLSYVYTAQLEREFRYRSLAVIRVLGTIAALAVAVGLAWRGAGMWSLLAREGVLVVLTYAGVRLVTPWRYTGRYHRDTARKLFSFGTRLFVTRALEVVTFRADIVLLGILAGTVALGFYDRARFLGELGHYGVSFVAVQVAFPLYARFQSDAGRLAAAYRIIHYFLIRAMLPVFLTLVILPEELVGVLYGGGWQESVGVLQWLAGYAFFLPILDNIKVLLTGIGRLREAMLIRLVQVAAVLPALGLAVPRWGAKGAAAVMTLGALIGIVVAYRFLRRHLPDLFLGMYIRPVSAGLLAAAAVTAGRHFLLAPAGSRLVSLTALAVLVTVYVGVLVALEAGELRANLRTLLPQLRTGEGPTL